jgi:hypothetical protein
MRLSPWLRMLTSRKQTLDRRPTRRRLELELLEDRTLPSGTTFSPIVTASIHDEPRDGLGNSFNTVFDSTVRQTPSAEDRAIAEFDVSRVAAAPVNLAVLDFTLGVNGQGTPLRTYDVYAYAGNGQGDLADFSTPGTKVGTVTLTGSQMGHDYRLDVTSAVQALLGGGNQVIGVRVDPVNDSTPTLFLDATLTINGAPAPSGERGWESIPNVIRMDGVDSFSVEVDVGGAVKAVTLDPFGVYLVAPNAGTVVLHDDGLNGDRVAGDFIYTSGAFRYNTSIIFENDHYIGEPNSPTGVHIVDVGDIKVEELDGTITPFLIRPAVGLLRNDIPLAPSVQVTPSIVTTEHLINISTDANATQRTLRGPANVMYQVTKPLYEQFRDSSDFLMFFSTNKIEQVPRLSSTNFNAGMHLDAKVDYTGSGRDPSDNTAWYGSAGRLQGLNLLDAYDRGIWGANATHELVHQWSAYIDPTMGVTQVGGHYDMHTSAGSLVGGFQWTPNGDGSYTINFDEGRNSATHASEMDLYMMGLLDASQVHPILAYSGPLKQPDNPIVQASEITNTVTIDDIIARHGVRPPATQHDFNLGFVAESHNRLLTPVELTFYEIFAAYYTKPIPAGQPDPHIDYGWQSITRFFGHGTTWSSAAPALRGVSADIVDVAPDPRATAVNQITIVFSDPVTGFDLSDLRLTRDGGSNLLTGAETLASADGITWTLSGLSGLTAALGNYELTLVAAGSGIQGSDGSPLLVSPVETWSKIPAKVTLSTSSTTVAEAGGTASITASLSQVTDTDVSIALAFTGSATLNSDYTRSAAQLTIPAGQTQASLTLTALQDTLDEDDETVIVDITGVTGAVEDDTQTMTAAILDDDPLPSLTIGDATPVVEGNSGAKSVQFVVQLSAASGRTVTVNYATAAVTATSGVDYSAVSNALTFAPGETNKTITVQVIGDRIAEPNETFAVNLSGATNASIANGQGVGTILDDEPRVSINDVSKSEGKKPQTTLFTFTVTLSAAYDQAVTMSFHTVNGTATTGDNDYIAKTGTLTFAPGETTKTITIEVKGDNKRESSETFYLDLFGLSNNALFIKSRGTGTILNDD